MTQSAVSASTLPQDGPKVQAVAAKAPDNSQAPAVLATADVPEPVLAALRAAGSTVTRFRPQDPGASPATPTDGCVVLWSDPFLRLSATLEGGGDLSEAVKEWLAEAQAVLKLFRQDRRRVLLIDARVLIDGAAEQDRNAARARLGCPSLSLPIAADATGASPLARMIVSTVLPQIPETRDVLEELEASSLSLPPDDFGLADLAAIGAELGQRNASVAEELTLLRTQIELQQQEIVAAKAAADRSIEALEARQRSATIEADRALSRALGDLRTTAKAREKSENDLRAMAKARDKAESELRATAKVRDKALKERDHLQREVAALALKLEKILKSKSWRITSPLRGIRTLLRGQRKPLEAGAAKGPKGGQAG